MLINEIEVRYMVAASLVDQKPLQYVDIFGLVELFNRLYRNPLTGLIENPPNILLTGPAGVGKTLVCLVMGTVLKCPMLSLDCSEDSRDRHIKGGFVAKDGSTPYVLGKVANAIHTANEVGLAILLLEEVNALTNQMQKVLNPVLDFRRKLEVPELSTRFALRDGAALIVMATTNPTSFGGTYEMNEDLKSRFIEIEVPYPSPGSEKRILREMAPKGVSFDPSTFDILVNIARETRQGATSYAISTRDLVQALEMLPRADWGTVLFLMGQKFQGQDRQLFLDRVRDITGSTIPALLGCPE
jgi:AAA+ superfamily predicted ATPase